MGADQKQSPLFVSLFYTPVYLYYLISTSKYDLIFIRKVFLYMGVVIWGLLTQI